MDRTGKKAVGDLSSETIKAFAVDFIVHNLSCRDAIAKYHITHGAYYEIRDRMDLIKKRDAYKQKVLDKALNKLAQKQSQILVDTVEILFKHVSAVKNRQATSDFAELDSEVINDIMKIAALLQKEKRLDEDKPTDNVQVKVIVEMPDVMYIGQKPAIPVQHEEAQVVAQEEKVIEAPKQETPLTDVKVKADDDIVGII
jgi:hypothetical protein